MWKRLDDSFSTDERFDGLDPRAVLLFLLLLPHSDCAGRFTANSRMIKSKVVPAIDAIMAEDIPALLRALRDAGLVELYVTDNRELLAIVGHDRLNPLSNLRWQRPKFPAQPRKPSSDTGTPPVASVTPSASSDAVAVPNGVATEGGAVPNGASPSPSHVSSDGGCREETTKHPRYADAVICAEAWRRKNGEGMSVNAAAQHFIRALVADVTVAQILSEIEKRPGVEPWKLCDALRDAAGAAARPRTRAQRESDKFFSGSG